MVRIILQAILLPFDILRETVFGLLKASWKYLILAPWWVFKLIFPTLMMGLIVVIPILLWWAPGYLV